eukprot:TRINITY_DN2575_c2_g2_i2.p1 TRINITY_DN2575_c2_g2~~TRINITY_DN2575_c2_g2_i2.p1  ORF type:complete len:235 (-),score=129.27 TRINITY_DN2575_c2_g2_i2:195-899(-)
MQKTSKILVYGGAGQLGRKIISGFNNRNWETFSVVIAGSQHSGANFTIGINPSQNLNSQFNAIQNRLPTQQFDTIVCASGGWAGDSISDDSFLTNFEQMINCNVSASIVCAKLIPKYLLPGGLVVFVGSKAALQPTPTMVSYGVSKAAVHHLIGSIASDKNLPFGASVLGLVPETIDTETNRQAMPQADRSKWADPVSITNLIFRWADLPEKRPKNGSLIDPFESNGTVLFELD